MTPPLLVTPGDPKGVGPEVTCKALARWTGSAVVVGAADALRPWATAEGLRIERVNGPKAAPGGVAVWEPPQGSLPPHLMAIELAARTCLRGDAGGMVTGPIHKARAAAAGFAFAGHTDCLAAICGGPPPVMGFVGGRVRVALVTIHVPLADVVSVLSAERVHHTVCVADRALRQAAIATRPRLIVCGVNPHAGDGGRIGTEDAPIVATAVARAREDGVDALGPVSAEAAFKSAVQGQADMVIAMYHDQGLTALKALEWSDTEREERAVNWSMGLPIVRVGVDHGTADDIAGTGRADAGSMLAALRLATQLVGND